MKTTFLRHRPEQRTIVICTCHDRGGHQYTHPFIGSYAIASRLVKVLKEEYNVSMQNGSRIPDSFFNRYSLVTVERDENDSEEGFVTSDMWYTCAKSRTASAVYEQADCIA